MPDPIPLSASDLRVAMRDPRYWRPGHPEQAAYHAWVRRLAPGLGGRGQGR